MSDRPAVHIEDEEMEAKYDGSDTAMAPQGTEDSQGEDTKRAQPTQQQQTQPQQPQQASSPSPTSASASASAPPLSSAAVSPASSVHLSVRVLSLRSSYTAKQNHFLSCDPLVVVAVDQRPMFKTSQSHRHTHSTHTHSHGCALHDAGALSSQGGDFWTDPE